MPREATWQLRLSAAMSSASASAAGADGPQPHDHGEVPLGKYAKGYMLPILGSVCLCFLVTRKLHQSSWGSRVPESAAILVLGALCGGVFLLSCHVANLETPIRSWDEIDEATALAMNFVLLPILIFEAGWNLNVHDFFASIGTVLVYAVGGTAVSAVVIELLVYYMSPVGMEWDEGELAAFSSMISAVDPVATLSTFQSLGVEPFLNNIVLGEALINDAVALVLFEGFNGEEKQSYASLALQMMWQLFGSSGVGVVVGHILVFIFRASHLHSDRQMAQLMVLLCPFVLYSSAVALNLSGIISTLFGGAFMGILVKRFLTDDVVREHIDTFLEVLAHFGDLLIFTMVGLGAALSLGGQWLRRRNYILVLQMSVIVFVACLIARAVAVFFLGCVRNIVLRWWKSGDLFEENTITPRRAIVMWWGGGLRGAVALVCALELHTKNRSMLVDVTMVNIYLTVIVFGGTTESLLRYLGIPLIAKEGDAPPGGQEDQEPGMCEMMKAELVEISPGRQSRAASRAAVAAATASLGPPSAAGGPPAA